uniref:Transcription termination factor 1, tandem duplicate 5 n=1 Tax=Lepisosteus oculatus TaxID=7918 RepID=W5MEB6_LEPOC
MRQGIEPICDDEVQRYIIQLKEFIPNVEKRCPREIIKMGVYDLERFQAFKREGIVLRRGRYSAEENDRLRKNVENFLLLTGIDTATKLFFPARYPNEKTTITKLKNVHKFHKQIADGIPRPWHDIYTRGRKMFDSYNYKGRFTEDDLKALRKYHSMYGNNWTKISELMGRSNHSLEMRFSQMAQNKGVWRKEELRALMRAIGAHMLTQLDPEEAARGQQATIAREKLYKGIPWVEVALKVQTRSWCQCRTKWMSVLMKKMSLGEDVYKGSKSYKAKINLIKKLYSLNVEDVADVNWDDLTDTIGDVPPAYVQAKFYKLKVTCVPLWQNKSFGDIIDYLYINTLPKLEDKLMKTEQLAEQNNLNCRKSDYYLLSEILNDDFIEEVDSGDQEV